jgi:hypothetical protein
MEVSSIPFATQRSPFLGLFAAQRVIVSRFHSAVAPMRASGCGTLWRLTQLRQVVTWTPRKSATSYAVHQSLILSNASTELGRRCIAPEQS